MQQQLNNVTRKLSGFNPFALPEMNSDRYTAVIIWLVGVYLSRTTLMELGIENEIIATIAALLFQWALTKGQQRIWRAGSAVKRFTFVSVPALLADVAINFAGAWPFAKHIGDTAVWKTVNEIAGTNTTFSTIGMVVTALLVGLFIAGAPENLWNGEEAI